MTSDLHAKLTDAARTALEIIRRERAGDLRGLVDLVSTYDEFGKGLIFGAMASAVNCALAAVDEVCTAYGEPPRGEELLEMMAVGLPEPGGREPPGGSAPPEAH